MISQFCEQSPSDGFPARQVVYTTEEALKWCLQLAEGLAYLHAQRPVIVHRDLKLENCLLTGVRSKI